MKTQKELKQLAKKVYDGEIFLSNDQNKIVQCFPIIYMLDSQSFGVEIGSLYEEMRHASPRSINGMPMFFSCNILTIDETKDVINYLKEIEELMKEFN